MQLGKNRNVQLKSMLSGDLVLVGHPFAPIGMGEHVRSSFRAFRAAGIQTSIRDIYGLSKRDDPSYEAEFGGYLAPQLSPTCNIFHINGDEIEQAIPHLNDPNFEKAYNIVYPAWELSKYPEAWAHQLERFDEVWAPSMFIREAIARVVTRPVLHMPLAVEVGLDTFLGRRYFEIPEHTFVYVFFFDFSSYMERKNPFGVLNAFLKVVDALPNAPLHCVLKFKGGSQGHKDQAKLQSILEKYRDRIQTITRELTDNEIKNLVRCADCFVSLHRSEGFGRGIAEAMTLGRAAVATGYSGNMDFMTPDTSYLVDYALIPVARGSYPFAAGQHWADPDLDHAAQLMMRAYTHPDEMRAKAEAARRHMRARFSARAIGLRYLDRLEEIPTTPS
jgi:glycosyltransferase involved in cell wall biosynthesis